MILRWGPPLGGTGWHVRKAHSLPRFLSFLFIYSYPFPAVHSLHPPSVTPTSLPIQQPLQEAIVQDIVIYSSCKGEFYNTCPTISQCHLSAKGGNLTL